MKIIVATNNVEKIKEIKKILKQHEIISLKEAGINIDVEETGETFEANALIKAREISKLTKEMVMADDSGLCVDYLNGFPGVKTHRILGEEATDKERNEYILEKLKDAKDEERNAEVVTSIAVVKGKKEYVVTAELNGKIAKEARGEKGFGFDPIFEITNGKTLGELVKSEKNEISSRKKAIEKLKKFEII